MPFRTTEATTIKSNQNSDDIRVPKGTIVTPIKCGGGEIGYAVIDSNVFSHDRKYRYVWVPNTIVESF